MLSDLDRSASASIHQLFDHLSNSRERWFKTLFYHRTGIQRSGHECYAKFEYDKGALTLIPWEHHLSIAYLQRGVVVTEVPKPDVCRLTGAFETKFCSPVKLIYNAVNVIREACPLQHL